MLVQKVAIIPGSKEKLYLTFCATTTAIMLLLLDIGHQSGREGREESLKVLTEKV